MIKFQHLLDNAKGVWYIKRKASERKQVSAEEPQERRRSVQDVGESAAEYIPLAAYGKETSMLRRARPLQR